MNIFQKIRQKANSTLTPEHKIIKECFPTKMNLKITEIGFDQTIEFGYVMLCYRAQLRLSFVRLNGSKSGRYKVYWINCKSLKRDISFGTWSDRGKIFKASRTKWYVDGDEREELERNGVKVQKELRRNIQSRHFSRRQHVRSE